LPTTPSASLATAPAISALSASPLNPRCSPGSTSTRPRTIPYLILLDSRGKQLSSEDLAALLGRHRDSATQNLVFAIGPADGWSSETRARANLLLSFGPITLPHELARIVLAEQLYRALTILAGHPYHSGH
jgi:23S rRNA (pseudouridine1915-N3)-methyltransferase